MFVPAQNQLICMQKFEYYPFVDS